MIASGPGGSLPSLRPAAEVQGQTSATRAAPPSVSGAPGEVRPAVGAETARAVDPARQTSVTSALPRDETNERANLRRGLVEPARYAPAMLAGETPTEATPAGPPPTFDLSILEKTRAVARAAPPVIPPPPERSSEAVPVKARPEADARAPGAREAGETRAEGARERPEARPDAPIEREPLEPAARDTAPEVMDDVAAPVPARRDPVPLRG